MIRNDKEHRHANDRLSELEAQLRGLWARHTSGPARDER